MVYGDQLLEKSAEQLQQQGILPIGTKETFRYETKLIEPDVKIAAETKLALE